MLERHGELIQQYRTRVRNGDGSEYTIQSWARRNRDGKWEGWLEFHPVEDMGMVRRTAAETCQSGLRELRHWAAALGDRYLEDAFVRSK